MKQKKIYKKQKKKYEKILFKDTIEKSSKKSDKKDKLRKSKEKAFKIALETRKFEIELFWKRALFFWGFISVSYVAYWNVFEKLCESKDKSPNLYSFALVVISSVIYAFSLIFHLANKGSKFWQENWEKHINYLEDEISGRIYKTWFMDSNWIHNPVGKYTFSLSKLTMMISFILILCALLLIFFSINIVFFEYSIVQKIVIELVLVIGISSVITPFTIGNKNANKAKKEYLKNKKENLVHTVGDEIFSLNE